MQHSMLASSTMNAAVDRLLETVITRFAVTFPQRVGSAYLQGSYADNSGVATSDVDLLIVFREQLTGDEQARTEALAEHCVQESTIELDIEIADEASLMKGIWPTLKDGSMLVYGTDIRASLPLIPLAEWTRDRMHTSLWRTVSLCQRSSVLTYPLTYPDPEGEFYGYDRRTVKLADGREVACTRDLIRLVGWSATAMLAFQRGLYVARKRDCHRLYREHIGGEWTSLLEDIYSLCRGRWHYLLPDTVEERTQLRAICERVLGFENHFLEVYKTFFLSELRSSDIQGTLRALYVTKYAVYQDPDIVAAIAALQTHPLDEMRHAALQAHQRFIM